MPNNNNNKWWLNDPNDPVVKKYEENRKRELAKRTINNKPNIKGPGNFFKTNIPLKKAAKNLFTIRSQNTQLKPAYVHRALNSTSTDHKNYIMLSNNGKNLHGFSIVNNSNKNSRYIVLLVTRKGYGKRLMNKIISNSKNKKTITLETVPSSANFYKKLGFKPNSPGSSYLILNLHR